MSKNEEKKPTIQVLERAFALLDVLASYQDPVSLKVISRTHGAAPVDRAPHPQRPDDRPLRRPPRGRQLPPGHAPARTRQPGEGAAGRARCRARPDARAAQADPPAGEPVDAPGRRDRLHRTHLQRTLGHAGGARHRRARAAAPHLGRQAVPGPRRPAARARLCHAHRPGRPHAQQHHRPASARARTRARDASTARRATTKSWSWGCAAWPPASSTTRATWSRACRSRRRPIGWKKPGWSG